MSGMCIHAQLAWLAKVWLYLRLFYRQTMESALVLKAAASPNDRGAWHSFPLGFPEGGIPPLPGELSASALAVKPRLTCTYPCQGPSDLDISKEETVEPTAGVQVHVDDA